MTQRIDQNFAALSAANSITFSYSDKDVFTIADALGEHISEGTEAENTKAY